MSKRKMCPQKINGKCLSLWHNGEFLGNTGRCPKNANSKCEIVEPKYKRFKGKLFFTVDNEPMCIDTGNHKLTDMLEKIFHAKGEINCTILIDRRHLGGKK